MLQILFTSLLYRTSCNGHECIHQMSVKDKDTAGLRHSYILIPQTDRKAPLANAQRHSAVTAMRNDDS